MKINNNIEAIILKVFSGEASAEEIERVDLWIKEDNAHKEIFLELKNIWDLSNLPFDPEEIDTDKAYKSVTSKLGFNKPIVEEKKGRSFLYYWQRIAAIAIIPLLVLSAYLHLSKDKTLKTEAAVYQEVFAPYGTRSVINLPDSSKVWLNAGSSIKYPIQFNEDTRHVSLNGEAYFEVESNKKRPFIVHTKMLEVKATGTVFNVEAYSNDSVTAVTLVKGIVDIKTGNDKTKLNPGEKMDYNHRNTATNVSETDTYKWCSWKDGILAFRNDPLEYVFKRLGQMYNINFVIKDKSLTQYVYHATFEGESLDEILHLLEVSAPIRYKKIQNRKDSNNFYHKQTIMVYKSK